MSNDSDKAKNSHRRFKDETSIQKQLKIAKSKVGESHKEVDQPHRLNKKHALDCGNPNCTLCGNPRKIFKELTTQEKRLFQDVDKVRDRHSNGLINDKENK